ncbi:MAG: hypothetical protein GF331_20185 [Chitinivibrionales bacterium]|nr:hypothetical protein [Chitinivibrionales bacterium]
MFVSTVRSSGCVGEARPWYAADGTVGGFPMMTEDITERRRGELALRRSEERFRLAQRLAGIGTWEWSIPMRCSGLIESGEIGSRKEENLLELTVADNGTGLPESFDIMHTKSLGVRLVRQVTKHQLRGTASVESDHGLRWHIRFPEDLYRERL